MWMGVANPRRTPRPAKRIVALEPASSPLLPAGRAGSDRVEGLGVGVAPLLLGKIIYDEVRAVDEHEARAICRRPARKRRFRAGTSSAMDVVGAIALALAPALELSCGKVVAKVVCD
jgi:cysteine synthase